jgi:glycosyltransferase involved in cell wall biosynthesis
MHNLLKIKVFRIALWITYPLSFILVYPFALLRRRNNSNLFFFFDRYAIGGAQRIHIDILKSINEAPKQVYFTRKSDNDFFKKEFYSLPNTDNQDIHIWCDYLLFRLFTVHYFAFYINRHLTPHVFSSNSTFFYDMLPFLKSSVVKTELLHNFTFGKKGMEFFGLANVNYLNHRIVYDSFTLENIKKQYQDYKIVEKLSRILFIEPGVEIPASPNKEFKLPLAILYAGRGGPQKRIHLINKICEQSFSRNLPVSFHFAGTLTDELSEEVKSKSTIHGQISDPSKMHEIYSLCHIILMTSAYEGFPMFIKEGMARGCVPVVTALEGNKMHLTSGYNSLLIDAVEDEKKVVELGIEQIEKLASNLILLRKLSENAYTYARNNFRKEKFNMEYRKLLLTTVTQIRQ